MKDELKPSDVKMITSHPGFMKGQYDMHTPTRAEKLLTVGIYITTALAVALWAAMFALQILSPERAKFPAPWYN